MNNKIEKGRKTLDKSLKIDIITIELHTSLIKSGGGNGPMKPGNLLIQGAKSGGKRKMRIRYTHIESVGVRFFVIKKGKSYGKKIIYF